MSDMGEGIIQPYMKIQGFFDMMVSVGLGEFGVEASMSHLMSHASFKAGLFLAAGVVITSSGGYHESAFKLQTDKYKISNLHMFNLIRINRINRTGLTFNWAKQSTLFYNINSIRNYTTGLYESTLNNKPMDILPNNYVDRFSNLTPNVKYLIKCTSRRRLVSVDAYRLARTRSADKYKGVAVIYLFIYLFIV